MGTPEISIIRRGMGGEEKEIATQWFDLMPQIGWKMRIDEGVAVREYEVKEIRQQFRLGQLVPARTVIILEKT